MASAFTESERRRIAQLLELDESDPQRAERWLDWLSYEVLNARRLIGLWREWDKDIRTERARARRRARGLVRGRARVRKYRTLPKMSSHDFGAVHAAAVAYARCTHRRPTNSRAGPFYELAQICTRLSDPGPYIAKLPRPFSGQPIEDMQPLPE